MVGRAFQSGGDARLAVDGAIAWRDVLAYVAAQLAGAIVGVWLAHRMFDLPILEWSVHARSGIGQWTGEFVATFGLLLVIESGRRAFAQSLPAAIAAYITAAYWFTSSTSFANPAVTLARALTDSFAGIAPSDVAGFVLCQYLGAAAAVGFVRWLERRPSPAAELTARASPAIKAIEFLTDFFSTVIGLRAKKSPLFLVCSRQPGLRLL